MNLSQFKKICQKNENENYLIDKYIYREISYFGTFIVSKSGISPNSVTFISLIVCLCSLYFLTQNTRICLIVGAFLVFLYHYLDHVDGELARYYIHTGRIKPNLKGQYFDSLCHSFSDNIMFLCMAWAVYQNFGYSFIMWFGVIAMIGSNGFPDSIAARMLISKGVTNPDLFNNKQFQSYLWAIEKKRNQVKSLNTAKFSSAWLFKLCVELVGYPGVLSSIMIVVLIDAAFGTHEIFGYQYDFRCIFITLSALIRIIIIPKLFYNWMKKFETIH